MRPLRPIRAHGVIVALVALSVNGAAGVAAPPEAPPLLSATSARPPKDDADLAYWLENMVVDHHFDASEVAQATGLSPERARQAIDHLQPRLTPKPPRDPRAPLKVRPYPGGRHPRIGFLDGAIDPQRETKFSVFTPWDESSYVVVDLPEAIWSNLGLTYLAHTHVPTIWTKQGVRLPPQEWERKPGGVLESERRLPNGIVFRAQVVPEPRGVAMRLELTNGTPSTLTDLRVQQCVMLRGARGFTAQTNANKVFRAPYVACHSDDGTRWVITAWSSCHRAWGNAPCPCLHSDPKFPDCLPGATRVVRGWLSFYEGKDIEGEFRRIDANGWQDR